MRFSKPTMATAIVLILAAAYLSVSMALSTSGVSGWFIFSGELLVAGFRIAAWYIPAYLFFCAALLLRKGFAPLPLFVATAGVVPMVTAGFWLQLIEPAPRSAAADAFLSRFGSGGSSFILFLLLLAELIVIYLVAQQLFSGRTTEVSDREKKGPRKKGIIALPQPSSDEPEEEDDDAWWEEFERRRLKGVDTSPLPEISETPVPTDEHVLEDERVEDQEYAEEPPAESNDLPNDLPVSLEPEEDVEEEPVDLDFASLRSDEVCLEDDEEIDDIDLDESEDDDEDEEVLVPEDEEYEDDEEDEAHDEQEEVLPVPASHQAVARNIMRYEVPRDDLLDEYPDSKYWVIDEATRESAEILKDTLREFKIQAEVTGIRKGPVITMFEILPAPGVKLSKIVNLADNIALRLAASRVRIVAPIPGKHAVGIEVPNRKRALVSFKEMIEDESFENSDKEVPIILGKDITGETQIIDLVQTPHLLIAGATGSGKSVCVNSIICSILYKRSPDEVNMILIDPKIVELKLYNDIPHLLTPVITEPKKAFQALQYCLYEMERRYALLDSLGVRDIRSYNRKVKKKRLATRPLPYLVVIIDEFADLMATTGKELESTLARLAAMSRAVGIHLVLATQRPSIDVITGLIKANIPSRIAFMVAGKFDSRIIIDAVGAEKLLGRGDMLFTSAWDPVPSRIQGAYLSEEEVERIAAYVRTLGEPEYIDDEIFIDDEDSDTLFDGGGIDDPLMDKALEIVTTAGKASASYLQRRLKIGYNRAARLVEEMEERGIVGPQNGSKPREIIHVPDRYREGRGDDEEQ